MLDKTQIAVVAILLVVLGVAVVCFVRRESGLLTRRWLVRAVASLTACGALLAAAGLLAYVAFFFPEESATETPAVPSSFEADSEPAPLAQTERPDPDEQFRRLAIGVWTDNYRGKRTMTLNEDGTGAMVVELAGLMATLYAKRLQFDMIWSVQEGRLKKQTVGGEPVDKVQLILKLMGDRVEETILELTEDHLVLLDQDGETKYNWARVRQPALLNAASPSSTAAKTEN